MLLWLQLPRLPLLLLLLAGADAPAPPARAARRRVFPELEPELCATLISFETAANPLSNLDEVRGRWLLLSRRRECHSAGTPSPFSRCFNSDGERASAKCQSRRRLVLLLRRRC